MEHPDDHAYVSFSLEGDVVDVPNHVISVVVTDIDGEPAGVLEKWNADAWIWAEDDDLHDLN
jgi:hypothetical protein